MQEYDQSGKLAPKIFSFFLKKVGKGRPFILPTDVAKSSKLLFIDSGDVVDLLFAAPLINYFSRRYPDIRSMILVHDVDVEIVRGIMKIKKIITYERKQLRFYKADYLALIKKLRLERIDTVVVLTPRFSLERYLLAFASGAPIRIGFTHAFAFPFINCEIRLAESGYEGNKMVKLLRSIGLRPDEDWNLINLSEREVSHARQLIHFRKPEKEVLTVGLDPSRGKTKHFVIPEIIAYLANNLASRRKVKFLVLTNPWDEKLAQHFSITLKSEVIDLVPSNISEAVALLSQCDLFLSGNTNLFHFAAALQVPTIGLFTKYDGVRWVPDSAPHVKIFKGTRGEKLSLKSFFTNVEEVLSIKNKVTV